LTSLDLGLKDDVTLSEFHHKKLFQHGDFFAERHCLGQVNWRKFKKKWPNVNKIFFNLLALAI
jgi:hypothetical protein